MKKSGIRILNKKISLHNVCVPSFIFATKKDHIVPWQAAFSGTKILKNSTFVLGDSGHVAGIINAPSNNKYNHWVNPDSQNCMAWLENAVEKKGSWWQTWGQWLGQFDGDLQKSVPLNPKDIIEMAPGRYATDPTPKLSQQGG